MEQGHYRVLRGGSWNNNPDNCRAAYRNRNAPANRNNNYGFWCVFRLHGRGRLARNPRMTGFRPGQRGCVVVLILIPCRPRSRPKVDKKLDAGAGW